MNAQNSTEIGPISDGPNDAQSARIEGAPSDEITHTECVECGHAAHRTRCLEAIGGWLLGGKSGVHLCGCSGPAGHIGLTPRRSRNHGGCDEHMPLRSMLGDDHPAGPTSPRCPVCGAFLSAGNYCSPCGTTREPTSMGGKG